MSKDGLSIVVRTNICCGHPRARATREDRVGRYGRWYTRFDILCPDCGKHIEIDGRLDPTADVRSIIAQEFGETHAETLCGIKHPQPLQPTHDDQLDALFMALGWPRPRDGRSG